MSAIAEPEADPMSSTTNPNTLDVGNLPELIGDWGRSLAASNHAPRTITIYTSAASRLLAFLRANVLPTNAPEITRQHLEAYFTSELTEHKPATASQRYRALAQMWKWMESEQEVPDNPFLRMQPVRVPEDPVPILKDEQIMKLLKACEGTGFEEHRDMAMIRLLLDTGVRCGGLMDLRVDDLDRDAQLIFVVDKGRRGARPRAVPYGKKAAAAIDRYWRVRRSHPQADCEWLWVGPKGRLTDSGLRQMLERRGEKAGIGRVYPHMFRHSFALRWRVEGGNERDLMNLLGWRSPQMLSRYGASAAAERARESHKRMGLGDRY